MDDDPNDLDELQWKAELRAMALVIQEEGIEIFPDDEAPADDPDADHVGTVADIELSSGDAGESVTATDGDLYAACSGDGYGEEETDAYEEQEVPGLVLDSNPAACDHVDLAAEVEEVEMVLEDDEDAEGEEEEEEEGADDDGAFFVDTSGQQEEVADVGLSIEDGVSLEEATEMTSDQDAVGMEDSLLHTDQQEDLEQEEEQEECPEQPEHDESSAMVALSVESSGSLDAGPDMSNASTLDDEPELADEIEGSGAEEVDCASPEANDGAFFPLLQIAASTRVEQAETEAPSDVTAWQSAEVVEEEPVVVEELTQEEDLEQADPYESDALADASEGIVGATETEAQPGDSALLLDSESSIMDDATGHEDAIQDIVVEEAASGLAEAPAETEELEEGVAEDTGEAPEEVPLPEAETAPGALPESPMTATPPQTPASSSNSPAGATSGYVFMCSNGTQKECESRRLFGAPPGELAKMQRSIQADTQLFLLNFNTLKLMGPFVAFGTPERDIEPGAFAGKFRSQICVAPLEEPVMEMKVVGRRISAGPKSGHELKTIITGLSRGKPAHKKVQEAWFGIDAVPAMSAPADEQQSGCNEVEDESESSIVAHDHHLMSPGDSPGDSFDTEATESQLQLAADSDDAELAAAAVDEDAAQVDDADDAGAEFHEAFDSLPEADPAVIDDGEVADADMLCDEPDGEEAVDNEDPDAAHGIEAEAVGGEEALDSEAPCAHLRTGTENGYVFFCNNNTQKECATLRLLGSPEREFDHMKHTIKPDTQLFLFNFESKKLLGTFIAAGEPQMNIVPSAFTRRFSAQVRVLPVEPLCQVTLSSRPSAGMKTADEVMALMDSLLNSGAASDAIQRAWSSESIDEPPAFLEPPAKKQKLGGGGAIARTPARVPARIPRSNGPADENGRAFNLRQVVVNFANVGASYAEKVLGRDSRRGDRMFDWEGVRRCIRCLTCEQGMQVIGVLFENFKGPDNGSGYHQGVPADITKMCTFIQETPRLTGRNHKSADDEVTIKCAFRRNCRFLDNDNYRDWLNHMSNDKVRIWLENRQELLQMRYFFDAQMGTFDTLDGNIPAGLLACSQT